jgi:hypothetical protein
MYTWEVCMCIHTWDVRACVCIHEMCMRMYIYIRCVCMYIYIYIYIHEMCVYAYIYMRCVCMCMYTKDVCVCVFMQKTVCIRVLMFANHQLFKCRFDDACPLYARIAAGDCRDLCACESKHGHVGACAWGLLCARYYKHACVPTCTYIHTYIHTYIYIYIHTYIHIYIYTYIHTFMHTYTHSCIRTYIDIYIQRKWNKFDPFVKIISWMAKVWYKRTVRKNVNVAYLFTSI